MFLWYYNLSVKLRKLSTRIKAMKHNEERKGKDLPEFFIFC